MTNAGIDPASEASSNWEAAFFHRHSIYAPVASAAEVFSTASQWPSVHHYNLLSEQLHITNAQEMPLRFTESGPKRQRRRRSVMPPSYEMEVFERGEVPTRPKHWHDFFNMLIWCTYPATKAALNERQVSARRESGDALVRKGQMRTFEQNRLTMFDEGGVILACQEEAWLPLQAWLATQQSHATQTPETYSQLGLHKVTGSFIVGHALLEATQAGKWNLTAMAYLVPVSSRFFAMGIKEQCSELDRIVATALRRDLVMARENPIPGFPLLSLR